MKTTQNQDATQELTTLGSKIHRIDGAYEIQIRPLSETEWKRIKYLCETNNFAVYLFMQPYGYAVGIYGHRNQNISVEILLLLNEEDLPFSTIKKGFSGQMEKLHALFEIAHTESNKTLIKQYGLEPLRTDISQYAYAS